MKFDCFLNSKVCQVVAPLLALFVLWVLITYLLMPRPHGPQIDKTTLAISQTRTAISQFEQEYGRLPDTYENLQSNGNEKRRIFLSSMKSIKDSWGNVLRYTVLTNGFELRSAGKDGEFDTNDDIVDSRVR
jgi:hypothetical protein